MRITVENHDKLIEEFLQRSFPNKISSHVLFFLFVCFIGLLFKKNPFETVAVILCLYICFFIVTAWLIKRAKESIRNSYRNVKVIEVDETGINTLLTESNAHRNWKFFQSAFEGQFGFFLVGPSTQVSILPKKVAGTDKTEEIRSLIRSNAPHPILSIDQYPPKKPSGLASIVNTRVARYIYAAVLFISVVSSFIGDFLVRTSRPDQAFFKNIFQKTYVESNPDFFYEKCSDSLKRQISREQFSAMLQNVRRFPGSYVGFDGLVAGTTASKWSSEEGVTRFSSVQKLRFEKVFLISSDLIRKDGESDWQFEALQISTGPPKNQ